MWIGYFLRIKSVAGVITYYLHSEDMAIQVDPNVIISSVTLVVAFLALWFSSLRGPTIDFLKVTTPTYQKLADHPTFVPDTLYMLGLELLLANNGSRGGLVSGVRIETNPNPWFSPYFVRLNYSAEPIQIAAGESELMRVIASMKLESWKWFPTKLDPSLGFLAAIQTELNRNKDTFTSSRRMSHRGSSWERWICT